MAEAAAVQVHTPDGPVVAQCGDWIVLSHSGAFHVAHQPRASGVGPGRTHDA